MIFSNTIYNIHEFILSTRSILLPHQCFSCQSINYTYGICSICWLQLRFNHKPACIKCFTPFSFNYGQNIMCGKCIQKSNSKKYYLNYLRSALFYNTLAKKLILKFKNGQAFYLSKLFAKWMLSVSHDILKNTNLFIPVPLHANRIWWRGYNQSVLLSQNLSQLTHIPTYTNILLRSKQTCSQEGLSAKNRQKNVRGVFTINRSHMQLIRKKQIILIDDVCTTSATLNACAKTLKKFGAITVHALTVASTNKML